MAPTTNLKVGQTIEARTEKPTPMVHRGVIRYIGPIAQSSTPGDFIGLELSTKTGKNDGKVGDDRYFSCPPLHGIFVPRDKVTSIIAQPNARLSAGKATAPKPRPSSVGVSKSASQSSRLSTVGSAPKSTTAQSRLSIAGKASVRPAATTQPTRPPSGASRPSAAAPSKAKRLSVASAAQPSTTLEATRKPSITSPDLPEARPVAPLPATLQERTSSVLAGTSWGKSASITSAATSSRSASTAKAPAERTRQVSDIEYRRLQKQQEQTAELEQEAQRLRTENDKVKNILNKVQAKCQQQYHELSVLKENVIELKAENEEQTKALQDRDEMVELATIDKEMAEEVKEQLEAELENERAINEELRLELEIKQEEASFITDDMPEEEKQAAMLRQAQGERDRYREGIVRLRDMTREQIRELETRIRELESQVVHTESVQADLADANTKVARLEALVVDLQEQVDASNEWEEIHEELIEKNQNLEDSVSRLHLEHRELSTIIEVSNETINDYAEHAEELQAELGTRDSQLAEVTRERDEIQEENNQLQLVVSKHREVSLELQSRLRELEADKAITEEEVKGVTGRFNEVMELHRRLRTTTVNDVCRMIDTELSQLTSEEALEELAIIRLHLPESLFREYYGDSLRAYFRVKAIGFKASLNVSLLRTITTDQFSPKQGLEQILESLHRSNAVFHFQAIGAYAQQAWSSMATSTLEQFESSSSFLRETESVLRTLDASTSSVRNDNVQAKDCAESAQGSHNIMRSHTQLHSDLFMQRPDNEIILHVNNLRASLEHIRTAYKALESFILHIDLVDVDIHGRPSLDAVLQPARLAGEAFSIATKLSDILVALQKDGLYPMFPGGVQDVSDLSTSMTQLAEKVHRGAASFMNIIFECMAEAPDLVDAKFVTSKLYFIEGQLPDDFECHLKDTKTRIHQWHEHASVLMNCAEIHLLPAPWVVKAQELEADKKQVIEAGKKLQIVTTELHSTMLQIRERNEIIETKELEIEHLKARNQEAAVKAGQIESLQSELLQARSERDSYRNETKRQEAEIDRLESEMIPHLGEHPPFGMLDSPQPVRKQSEPVQTAQTNTSAAFTTLVDALEDENHWLRQRENSEMFGHNLGAIFTKLRDERATHIRADSRHKQARASEMLQMTFASNLLGTSRSSVRFPETPRRFNADDSDFWSDSWTPDAKSTPVPPEARVVSSRRVSPLTLAPIQTESSIAYMEDLSFVDLSPVAEEFSAETKETLEN